MLGECGTVEDCGDNAEDCLVIGDYTECKCNPGFWYNPYQKRCGKIVWFEYLKYVEFLFRVVMQLN